MAYLEPCCIENQLPQLLRQERGNALFQTNGDVTIEKLMSAACCMANSGFGEYWIVVKEVDVVLMRFLRHWMNRGWIRELRLLTEGDQAALISSELGDGRMKQVDYAWREGLSAAQMFCCVGDRETIVVQGEMLLMAAASPQVTSYSATLGPNLRMLAADGPAASLIENLRAILRVSKRKARKKEEEPKASKDTAEAKAEAEAPTEETPTEAVETPTVEQPETTDEAPTE